MKHILAPAALALGLSALATFGTPQSAHAVTCANGVYRAGCTGPNGAAVVRKRPPPPRPVTCANAFIEPDVSDPTALLSFKNNTAGAG